MFSYWSATLFVLALVLSRYVYHRVLCSRKLPLPPGPPTLPVLGHLFELVGDAPWKHFASLAETYGDVMHFTAFGQNIVVLSSLEAISDLFEERHVTYSDRVTSTMFDDIMRLGWIFALWDYGDSWRSARKLFHAHFSANATREYLPTSSRKIASFLRNLRDDPEHFMMHCRHVVAFVALEMIYGLEITNENDEMLVAAENWLEGFNEAGQPCRFLVDFIPILKYVPMWLPGAEFKRLGEFWRVNAEKIRTDAFSRVKESLEGGTATPCIALSMLERLQVEDDSANEESEVLVQDTCATAYSAAVDATTAVLQVFFLAMAMHPEVQKEARNQLDAVIGQLRLPTSDDRRYLPYIEAILEETLRWQPAAPISLPRRTAKDDVYQGYVIPKGSVVIPNSWKILRDPIAYAEPEEFKPERFLRPDGSLNPDIRDPKTTIFGVCPGADFASTFLFHTMACVLHAFEISPLPGDNGLPVRLQPVMHERFATAPEPFHCQISTRSEGIERLIHVEEHS
ncbi:cytochrome P450 [Panus rudis PR-1116 ss-1]|nr:cytochrome P450 [Panus rudis PR-1116 ss-1]